MKKDNEFLRKRPAQRNRNILFDLSNLIIPVGIAVAGIIISTQVFARNVGYNPAYTDAPVFITKHKFLFIDEGYPFYNPGLVFLNILSNPFDKMISAVILPSLFPLLLCAGIAVGTFFAVSAIRGYGLNKNDNLYGSARWANDKDMRKAGLVEEYGVVLAELQKADVRASINRKSGSLVLKLKKMAPLVCASSDTNFLMIAPSRSGKGVGSLIPTLLRFLYSMIIFDPKGELFNITAGFRKQFSHVLKFAPKNPNKDTCCFNPLEEVNLDNRIVSDVDLVIQNLFEEAKGGENSNSQFFNENAKDMIKTTILHVLTADIPEYADKKNLPGVFEIMSLAAKPDDESENEEEQQDEKNPGDKLFGEMFECRHLLNGKEAPWLETIIQAGAGRMLQMNPKVRSDVFSTVFSKLQLFSDPMIAYATSHSDFKLQDFVDSENPISLYLVIPFAHVDVVAPVFKLLINFMLRKFSDGETSYGEVKLKNKLLFLLDEFPVLGNFPFLVKCMGILAGYSINFYIVCQGLNQLIDIYGQNQPFLTHCKTQIVYAPGKVEDAKVFTDAIGKESVMKESLSTSGSRYAVALNNLNASSQEVARDLMNPDELMKLPRNECLIINQNDPPYIAKKCVYYNDPRFKYFAYSVRKEKDYRRYKFFAKPVCEIPLPFRKKNLVLKVPVFQTTVYKSGKKDKDGNDIYFYRYSPNLRKGFAVPFTKKERLMQTGFEPPSLRVDLEKELSGLPSNKSGNLFKAKIEEAKLKSKKIEDKNDDKNFNMLDYLERFSDIQEEASPFQAEIFDDEIPPTTIPLTRDAFSAI